MLCLVCSMAAKMAIVQDREDLTKDRLNPRWTNLARWGGVAIALVAAFLLWGWSAGAERRAVQSMPESERKGLFVRTVENLRTVCADPPEAMRDFCGKQAELALGFAECDRSCQVLAWRQVSRTQLPR